MSKVALHIALRADRIEGVVVSATVGPGICLLGGMKKAYDNFEMDPASCS